MKIENENKVREIEENSKKGLAAKNLETETFRKQVHELTVHLEYFSGVYGISNQFFLELNKISNIGSLTRDKGFMHPIVEFQIFFPACVSRYNAKCDN